jgi:hypothetical protein
VHDCIDTPEKFLRKLIIPAAGLAGIIFEELGGQSDPALLGVYLSLIGLGAAPWLRYFGSKHPNAENSHGD